MGKITEVIKIKIIMFLTAYIIAGADVIITALKNIKHGLVFDENFLMSMATIGAMLVGEYPEAIMVMILYKIGESLQNNAVCKSKQSISQIMDMRPDFACLDTEEGLKKTDPANVKIGDIIVVKPGERVPLDGIITDGTSYVDTSSITGESVLKEMNKGDKNKIKRKNKLEKKNEYKNENVNNNHIKINLEDFAECEDRLMPWSKNDFIG
mgnify:CR=1 FL=1